MVDWGKRASIGGCVEDSAGARRLGTAGSFGVEGRAALEGGLSMS